MAPRPKKLSRSKTRRGLNDIKAAYQSQIKEIDDDIKSSEKFETLQVVLNPSKMTTAAELLFKETQKNPHVFNQKDEKYQLSNTLKLLIREKSTDDLKRVIHSHNHYFNMNPKRNLEMQSSRLISERREERKTVETHHHKYYGEDLEATGPQKRMGSCTKTTQNVVISTYFADHSANPSQTSPKRFFDSIEPDSKEQRRDSNVNFVKKVNNRDSFVPQGNRRGSKQTESNIEIMMEEKIRKISSLEKKLEKEKNSLFDIKNTKVEKNYEDRLKELKGRQMNLKRNSFVRSPNNITNPEKNIKGGFNNGKKLMKITRSRRQSRNFELKTKFKSNEYFPKDKNKKFFDKRGGVFTKEQSKNREFSNSTKKTHQFAIKKGEELMIKDYERRNIRESGMRPVAAANSRSRVSSSINEKKNLGVDRSKSPVIVSPFALETIKKIAENSKRVRPTVVNTNRESYLTTTSTTLKKSTKSYAGYSPKLTS